jgi:hypothetical protein
VNGQDSSLNNWVVDGVDGPSPPGKAASPSPSSAASPEPTILLRATAKRMASIINRAVPQNSGGQDRPNTIGNPHSGPHSLSQFFNTAVFAPQPLGTIGNTQRNSLTGPHFRHVDLSLVKNFPVTERMNMQFRVETFNISNTPNLFIANNNSSNQAFGNASFGTVCSYRPELRATAVSVRTQKMQF